MRRTDLVGDAGRMNAPLTSPAPVGPRTFACPACGTQLVPGVRVCSACGADLVSPTATRLWEVEQELVRVEGLRTDLTQEAQRLRVALVSEAARRRAGASDVTAAPGVAAAVAPASVPPAAMPAAMPAAVPAATPASARFTPAPLPAPAPHPGWGAPGVPPAPAAAAREPRRSIGGQQLLLGLGAFLLLSGAAFFLWIVWGAIGVGGQAVVMLTLTGAAAASARWATRTRLSAAAETAAVIATGLLALDVTAAHRLGLFGLDTVDAHLYFGLAGVLGALVLVGFDRLVPARDADGNPLRAIATYRPAAALAAAGSAWHLTGLGDSSRPLVAAVLLGLVFVAGALVTWVAHRFDVRGPRVEGVPVSVVLAAFPTGLALLAHLVATLGVAYGPGSGSDRWLAAALLAVGPVVALAASTRVTSPVLVHRLRIVALLGAAAVLGVPVWAAPREVLLGLGVLAAVALVAVALRPVAGGAGSLLRWGLSGVAVGMWALLLLLDAAGSGSMIDLVNGRSGAGDLAWWVPVLPLVGLLVERGLAASRRLSGGDHALLQVVFVAASFSAMRRADAEVWALVAVALTVLSLAAATFVAHVSPARRSLSTAHPAEWVHASAGALFGLVAFGAATVVGPVSVSLVCLVPALFVAALASRPGRLPWGFVSVLLVAVATGVLVDDAGVETLEAYTLVPALGLLLMGWLMHREGSVSSSAGVMGPALLVGLLPSALVALDGEVVARTLLVTLAALVLLLGGCAVRWKAPVVAGALALVGVGISQGGALIEWLPGWSLLVGAGAVLLVVGVMWEKSLQLGRRSTDWLASLW